MISVTPKDPNETQTNTPASILVILRNSRPLLSGAKWDSDGVRRFALQAQARELLPSERVTNCLRLPLPHVSEIDVISNGKRANFTNLIVCASVWSCPVCASRISEIRRLELAQGLENWLTDGKHKVFMATFTFSHQAGESLGETLGILKEAKRFMKSGRRWQAIAKRFGIVGTVTANEITFGSNGFHPHQHELLFVDTQGVKATFSLATLERELSDLWLNALGNSGKSGLDGIACDVVSSKAKIADYVTKFGQDEESVTTWNLSHEMTKIPSKKRARGKRSWTMNQLLELAFFGVQVAGDIWREYAQASKGKQQLIWSRGLKNLLGVTVSDDTLAASQETDDMQLLGSISLWDWRAIVRGGDRLGKRGKILEIAKQGKEALRQYLHDEYDIELQTYE